MTKTAGRERDMETLKDLVPFLQAAISGALKDKQSKEDHEHHYGKIPQVDLTAEERKEISDLAAMLGKDVRSLELALAPLPDDVRESVEYYVGTLMVISFQIGQKTKYNPAVLRSVGKSNRYQTHNARNQRSKATSIIKRHWNADRDKHPNSSFMAAARRIERGVDADIIKANLSSPNTKAIGSRNIHAIAKTIERLAKGKAAEDR
jgi:hypothetical protein